LQYQSLINGDDLQNLRRKTTRTFRNNINELEINNKNRKNIRDLYKGINEFRKGDKPRINIIKDETDNFLADPQCVLN
jgi:hypothetical protein